MCWPKHTWILKNGVITIKILPIIKENYDKKDENKDEETEAKLDHREEKRSSTPELDSTKKNDSPKGIKDLLFPGAKS